MMLRGNYEAHELFLAPARPTSELWRLGLGIIVVIIAFLALNLFYGQLLIMTLAGQYPNLMGDLIKGHTPVMLLLLLSTFSLMLLSVIAATTMVHQRSPLTLLGPLRRFFSQFGAVVFLVVLLFITLTILPPWGMGAPYRPGLPLGEWVLWLPLSLAAVLLQVSAEEIAFRGYLQQQLAARFRSPLIWMVIPSVAFGALHLTETAGENALLVAAWATLFGMLMADLTARAGSLGPAIAIHFCNNVSALLFVSLPDELSGLALYLTPFSMEETDVMRNWLYVDFAFMLVTWLTARLAIRR